MAERWRYVDEEMPELNTTVLVVVETDSPFGKVLGSYLDNYGKRNGWGRTIEDWDKASREGDKVLAWLPIPKFERKEKKCKHCLGCKKNEIGEDVAFCEIWDLWRNVTLGDCFGNCEDEENK